MLDAGYWMLDAGCWMLDTGGWILDAGYCMLITASAEREAGCKWLLSFKTYLRPATICCAGVSGK